MQRNFFLSVFILLTVSCFAAPDSSWIRINQLGYLPNSSKVAVWVSKQDLQIRTFSLVDAASGKTVLTRPAGKPFGKYGPFLQSYRLNFSAFIRPGKYFLRAGNTVSPVFAIDRNVYAGTADFCLQYLRQQRSGFNPFLNDSCHTHDGYTMYGASAGLPDSTHMDATGGWHDASDYLQYSTTTANTIDHLLMAYRDFPGVFSDWHGANGLHGRNGRPDILDEAKWGLDWLLKMHPRPDWLFNQLGDDRDHRGMRIPKEDTYYGRGFERPVYYINGEVQQRGKFLNNTKGTSSTAAKFSSAFSLAAQLLPEAKDLYRGKAQSALDFAYRKPGVTQTVSVVSPYIYAEDNWVDDMELAHARLNSNNKTDFLSRSFGYAKQEPLTPWLGKDTASHYQWYPFINLGHYELAKQLKGPQRDTVIGFYKKGIEAVWNKASQNAFYRGVPFIWCSNNLTVAFAMQCKWYQSLTGSKQFEELEQANIDWIFGCNPWGSGMVYGLPAKGDTPVDPHSAFTHLKNYPINGGLVDGPVYTSIYKNLIGIRLSDPDEYAEFQSDLAVYHDDYGDYSTNEPTMDGTASLIYLLAAQEAASGTKVAASNITPATRISSRGAVVKAVPATGKSVALVFTADEFGEGLPSITQTLKKENVQGSFFFTGSFYRNPSFTKNIQELIKGRHYLGPHSDRHLLYADWNKRDSLLVSYTQFSDDLNRNLLSMEALGIQTDRLRYFIPPYEWWNDSIASWTNWRSMELVSFTPGTYTNADYTWPEMGKAYRSSNDLMNQIHTLLKDNKLNGSILLIHAGTDPRRTDKFYHRLGELILLLKQRGYTIKRLDELLN
ncbi:MAG TPA: glycoside hydrolase family 9 protein [Sediminibacterium sp.]|nr:glycoside hydrolase family 9 protein [Sediminibacterium sp.]